jgi:hypothetical protein
MLVERMINQYGILNKTSQYLQIESFIVNIAYLLLYFNSAAPFYTYFISSRSFRQDFKQLIINTYWKITRQTPDESVSTTNQTLRQHETRV